MIVDVDGVLTNGTIYLSNELSESKGFSTRDGLVLGRMSKMGLSTCAISGRKSKATEERLRSLRFDELHLGHLAKWPIAEQVIQARGLRPEETAFIGDDLVDVPAMAKVGLSVAPMDAHPAVLSGVDIVLNTRGGSGCVREFCDYWLIANGKWQEFVNSFEAEPK